MIIAQDITNDITILSVVSGFIVRYGADHSQHATLEQAIDDFNNCLKHALEAQGY